MLSQNEPLFETIDGKQTYRGILVERRTVRLSGREFHIAALKDVADLLDQPDFAEKLIKEDRAPYGMELWPAALMLGEFVLEREEGRGRQALELGCGLALVSMAAIKRGWDVTATDNDDIALRFAEYNASLNDIVIPRLEELDWHNPPPTHRYDLILGADLLYQKTDYLPILRCIKQMLSADGVALLADPNRGVADRFEKMATDEGFELHIHQTQAIGIRDKPVKGRIFEMRVVSTLIGRT